MSNENNNNDDGDDQGTGELAVFASMAMSAADAYRQYQETTARAQLPAIQEQEATRRHVAHEVHQTHRLARDKDAEDRTTRHATLRSLRWPVAALLLTAIGATSLLLWNNTVTTSELVAVAKDIGLVLAAAAAAWYGRGQKDKPATDTEAK